MDILFVIQEVSDADGWAIRNVQIRISEPQINAQPTAPEANTNAAIGAAAAHADIGAHGGLDGLSIRAAPCQSCSDRYQQQHVSYPHHTSAFHRLIWART